jgi:hypothetical protein
VLDGSWRDERPGMRRPDQLAEENISQTSSTLTLGDSVLTPYNDEVVHD